jgi:hypothetical protein
MTTKRVIVKKDISAQVIKALKDLGQKAVLVGIPASNGARSDGPLNNATIGYLMERGMPEQNVPARPFLVPGVHKSQRAWIEELLKAATVAAGGDARRADQYLNAAGNIAASAVKVEIGSNIPPPLAPSTIRGRKYARGTKSRRTNEQRYLALVKGGMDPGAAQSATGLLPLINTGSLRNSITYVLRRKGR